MREVLVAGATGYLGGFIQWAVGEKQLKWYPEGEHVCADYLDEVIPYTIDWLRKYLQE